MITPGIFLIFMIVIGLYKLYLANEDRFRFKSYNKVDPYGYKNINKPKNEILEEILLLTFHKATQSVYKLVKVDAEIFVVKQTKEDSEKEEKLKIENLDSNFSTRYLNFNISNEGLIEIVKFTYSGNTTYSIIHFNFNGVVVSENNFSKDYLQSILIKRENGIIDSVFQELGYSDIVLLNKKNNKFEDIDLLDYNLYPEKDWGSYMYVNTIVTTNKPNQIGCIVSHSDWSVDGVKIFNLKNELELVYDLDFELSSGSIHNLIFNSTGDRFVTLLYQSDKVKTENTKDEYIEDEYNYSIKILEYSIDNQKSYENIIKTDLEHFKNYIRKVHYITDRVLCIIDNDTIHLYDLEKSSMIEKIRRDFDSAFFVTFNCLLYVRDKEIKHFRLG